VFSSAGQEAVAVDLAARARAAWEWSSSICDPFFPTPPLLVLDADDWTAFAPMPVFGMPQAWSDRLIAPVAGGDLFDDYAQVILRSIGDRELEQLTGVYGSPPEIGLPISRLAVAHEVGHYFHFFDDNGAVGFARHWIAELFANIVLYGYVAEREPRQLPVIETIVETNEAVNPVQWSASGIDAMGGGSPSGYIWAQFRLIHIAKQIWQNAGVAAFGYFHSELREPSLTDDAIVKALTGLDPRAATAVQRWSTSSSRDAG
jgi:hypothetical protein